MSAGFLSNPLPWILPPFLGAIIGYVTNALAIRMLFRPLKVKRVFGLRLPLTPGIIPKQRSALAESIGRMVSEQLINAETLQSKLGSESFHSGVKRNIEELSARLLSTPLSKLKRDRLSVFYESLDSYLGSTLHRFFGSDRFQATLKDLIGELLHSFAGKTLGEVVNRDKLRAFIRDRIMPTVMQDGKLRRWMLDKLGDWINTKLKQNVSLEVLIPEEVVTAALAGFRSMLPSLLESLFRYLRSDSIRSDMEVKGRFLLKDILDKLNNFQRFFISVGQYDRTLEEKMPEIVIEALEYFEQTAGNAENRDKIVEAMESGLLDWRKRGLADVVFAAGLDLEKSVRTAAATILDRFEGGDSAGKLLDSVDSYLRQNSDRTLSELIDGTLGISEEEISGYLVEPLIRALSRRESADVIAERIIRMAEHYLQENSSSTVGELVSLSPERKARIDDFAVGKLLTVISERLPGLVGSLDVRKLVEDKINSLDVAQVEKLLMIVIAKHLKWINVFGAMLGAIIGLSQVILNVLR